MNFRFFHLAMPIGGALVGVTLSEPRSEDYTSVAGSNGLDALLAGDMTVVAIAVLLAVLVIAVVTRVGASVGLALVGAAFLSVPLLNPTAAGLYFTGAGAGLLLGGLLVLCGTGNPGWLQSLLAAGIVIGSVDLGGATPRRYADYLPTGESEGTIWLLVAGTVLLTVFFWGSPPTVGGVDRRALIVGFGIPAIALISNWAFVCSLASTPALQFSWRALVAAAVVAGVVMGAALWLPGATGVVLIVGLAIATVDAQPVFVSDRRWMVVALLLVAPGLYLGWRWRRPVVGIAILGVVAAVGVADETAASLLLPAAAVFALASSLPTHPAVAASALLAPFLFEMPFSTDIGWTSYASPSGWYAYGPSWAFIVVAGCAGVATIVLGAVIARVLVRREQF